MVFPAGQGAAVERVPETSGSVRDGGGVRHDASHSVPHSCTFTAALEIVRSVGAARSPGRTIAARYGLVRPFTPVSRVGTAVRARVDEIGRVIGIRIVLTSYTGTR